MLSFEILIENSESKPKYLSDYQIRLAWGSRQYKVYSSRGWEGSFRDLCDARLFIDALEALEDDVLEVIQEEIK